MDSSNSICEFFNNTELQHNLQVMLFIAFNSVMVTGNNNPMAVAAVVVWRLRLSYRLVVYCWVGVASSHFTFFLYINNIFRWVESRTAAHIPIILN